MADFFEGRDQRRGSDAVSQPKTSQAEDLGESPAEQEIGLLARKNLRDEVDRIFKELDIRLIHDNEHVLGHFTQQPENILAGSPSAGGVVGIGQEEHTGAGRDRPDHGRNIGSELDRRHGHQRGSEQGRHDGIHREAELRNHHLDPRSHHGMPYELEKFIGAVAQDEVLGPDPHRFGESPLEHGGGTIGVKVQLPQHRLHGHQGFGRGAEGVFVGGQLDDAGGIQTMFAGDFLDGPTGHIHRQGGEGRIESG